MIAKIIKELGRRIDAQSEKLEVFNKDLQIQEAKIQF